jgi:catechol 2,3-dioxygenase-like lactoylglutathione lyase family enzyme
MMWKSLFYVTIYVSDQDRALAFYTEKLGLEKRDDIAGPYGRWLTVATGDGSVEIILWPGHPGQGPVVEGEEPGTVPGLVFLETDDLTAAFDVLRSRGGIRFEEPAPTPYPFGVRLTALDPDGNRIALRQRSRGQGSD